jgi:ribosomal protein S18 acetylase RimI-like enzyme
MPDIALQYRAPTNEERDYTAQRLREHTEAMVGMQVSHAPFGLFAYEGKRLTGSIIGKIFFHWLHIDLVWIEEDFRGRGLGRRLMESAADRARGMGLLGIEVWTQSWQAPEFYRRLGYEEFAVLDDFTPGRKRHAFRLHLVKRHA